MLSAPSGSGECPFSNPSSHLDDLESYLDHPNAGDDMDGLLLLDEIEGLDQIGISF
jgi:hypothetical protein